MSADIGSNFVANYLHYAVGIFAVGGVLLYAIIEKEQAGAKSGAFAATRWGVNGGSIPVCITYIAAAFKPDLWVALQNYSLLATIYGTYHLVQTAQATKPTLRAYCESKGWRQAK